ncbi:MAG: bifunctional metallophosphatase/5'-nucleotidase [Firmicutes bacterium]|nr:bifunctional metallophosphatase/5'-nucleotidase [Bacillota bacterium]
MAARKLTILHSNDLHGDFFPRTLDDIKAGKTGYPDSMPKGFVRKDGKYPADFEIGGLSRLSGYVKKVREENENVIYLIAGDNFRGSIIDEEYLGLSTIELVNLLGPDATTIGNHEVDYGIAHLLFLEKCARFPIINADLFVTLTNTRLFTPYINLEVNGSRILVIGILTDEVIASTKQEKVIGSFIDIEQAAKEVGIICDNYRTTSTDLTILLTHVGLEKDKELASLLDPDWGVDLIIGGHSHTFMMKPEVVNGVPIVQAGTGSGQIGRFDIEYEQGAKGISSYKWNMLPVNSLTAPTDPVMDALIDEYRTQTDAKYRRVVTTFKRALTHPSRIEETELGNLYADLLQNDSSFDVMFMGTGAIRKKELGPVVEYQDMLENTPFDDPLWMVKVTGSQLERMLLHIFRDEAWEGHTEFYNFSQGFRVVYSKKEKAIKELSLNGDPIRGADQLLIAMQAYHFNNFTDFMGVPIEEVAENMRPRVISSSVNSIVEEYFMTNHGLDSHVEGRITILD